MVFLKLWNCLLILTAFVISIHCLQSPQKPNSEKDNYEFSYAVKDDFRNDFSHNAHSNGDIVTGEYRTLLPDSRVQIVRYQADGKSGYNAHVFYSGSTTTLSPKPLPKITVPRPIPSKKLFTTPYNTNLRRSGQDCRQGAGGENCNSASTISKTKFPVKGHSALDHSKSLLKMATPGFLPLTTSKVLFSRPQPSYVDRIQPAAAALVTDTLSCGPNGVGPNCVPETQSVGTAARRVMSDGYSYPKPKFQYNY